MHRTLLIVWVLTLGFVLTGGVAAARGAGTTVTGASDPTQPLVIAPSAHPRVSQPYFAYPLFFIEDADDAYRVLCHVRRFC